MSEVVETQAEVIEPVALISKLDTLVQQATATAATWDTEFAPREPNTEEELRQVKRERADIRRQVKEIETARKALFSPLKALIKEKEDLLRPVEKQGMAISDAYKEGIDAYTERATAQKLAEAQEFYQDYAPDLAALVPFEKVKEQLGEAGKWNNATTNIKQIEGEIEQFCSKCAADEKAIEALGLGEEDIQRTKALYFSILDISTAIKQNQADREQRERIAALEAERAERARAVQAVQDVFSGAEVVDEPASTPEPTEPEGASQQPATPLQTLEFTVEVTEAQRVVLVEFMKANNIHGKLRRVK